MTTRQAATRVSPLELLLDLVFLFSVTRVTHMMVEHPDPIGIGRAAVVLFLVYLMYDGYVWLMNQLGPHTERAGVRVSLLVAMSGFLLLATAIPHAFDTGQWLFGVIYGVLAMIHFALFSVWGTRDNRLAIRRAGPINLLAAAALVAGALLPLEASAWAPLVAAAVIVPSMLSTRGTGFDLTLTHIAERHGLLMIIVFGEAIVSVGSGIAEGEVRLVDVLFTALAVGVVGAAWWTYFSGADVDDAARRSADARTRRRSALVVRAFFVDHLLMMLGLVLFAAGIVLALHRGGPTAASTSASLLIGSGIGLYLIAQGIYRAELGLAAARARIVVGVLLVPTAIAGLAFATIVQLAIVLGGVSFVVVLTTFATRSPAIQPPTEA